MNTLLKFLTSLTDKVKKDLNLAGNSFVLRALKILGLEEMLKLSEVLQVKQVALKKAAGAEHIVWDDAAEEQPRPSQEKQAKILTFPKKSITDFNKLTEKATDLPSDEASHTLLSTDMVLWQRGLARNAEETIHKLGAFQGYKKATEIYVVKSNDLEGKEKIRFASTNGVLVNKKQA